MDSLSRTVFLVLALLASASAMPQRRRARVALAAPEVAFAAAAPAVVAAAPAVVAAAPAVVAAAPAVVAAAPAAYPIIPVLRRTEVHDEQGQYALGFETGNGIIVEEQGALKRNLDGEWKDDVVLVMRGSYSYPGPDGVTYRVEYTADENGFHPTGAHLPVAPLPLPVPVA